MGSEVLVFPRGIPDLRDPGLSGETMWKTPSPNTLFRALARCFSDLSLTGHYNTSIP